MDRRLVPGSSRAWYATNKGTVDIFALLMVSSVLNQILGIIMCVYCQWKVI
jgi:maltodextrin utilization protein YvdJ